MFFFGCCFKTRDTVTRIRGVGKIRRILCPCKIFGNFSRRLCLSNISSTKYTLKAFSGLIGVCSLSGDDRITNESLFILIIHHFKIVVCYLLLQGNNIFSELPPDDYRKTIGYIEHAILSTDLQVYFKYVIFILPPARSFVYSFALFYAVLVRSVVRLSIGSFVTPFVCLSVRSFGHSFVCLFVRPFIRSLYSHLD